MTTGKLIRYGLVVLGMTVMLGCATSPPEQVDNVCDIFRENRPCDIFGRLFLATCLGFSSLQHLSRVYFTAIFLWVLNTATFF